MLFKRRNKRVELFDHPTINEFEERVAGALKQTVYTHYKDELSKLINKEIKLSGIDEADLLTLFTEDKEDLFNFTFNAYSKEIKLDDIEEYPEGEELTEEEKPVTVERFGPSIGFGIKFAIYYNFLKNDKNAELGDFLKAMKIPYSSRFKKRLIGYYKNK